MDYFYVFFIYIVNASKSNSQHLCAHNNRHENCVYAEISTCLIIAALLEKPEAGSSLHALQQVKGRDSVWCSDR